MTKLKWEIAKAALADLADEAKVVYEVIAYDPEGYDGTSHDRGEVVAVLKPTVPKDRKGIVHGRGKTPTVPPAKAPRQPAFEDSDLDIPEFLRKRK